jgi:hypothetical protein
MKNLFLGMIISACLLACNNEAKKETASADSTTITSSDEKPATALLNVSEADPLKKSWEAFARGDVDAMTTIYDDTVFYTWSGGDTLRGKQALTDYYKGRRNLIDSIGISEQIVLPVRVNESQSKAAPVGKWILFWAAVDVKYKNGKKIHFWMHNVNHYNDAGKIDFAGQYIDFAPIKEATKGMAVK